MFVSRALHLLAVLLVVAVFVPQAYGDGEGQSDLDEALVARLDAKSLQQMQKVADLLQSALKKGLDEDNEAFARQMLAGVSLDRGKAIAQRMFQQPRNQDLRLMRSEAVKHLKTATENDPTLAEAHTLIARLEALPGGDRKLAMTSASAAIDALKDDPLDQSGAFVLRAMLQQDKAEQLADLNKAIELNADNVEAYQARSILHFRDGKVEEAVSDLKHLLEVDPTNTRVTATAVKALAELDRTDEAKKMLEEGLKAKPDSSLYVLRAAISEEEEKIDDALADLEKAIELAPADPSPLFSRARIFLSQGKAKLARKDLDRAMELKPGSVQGVLLRAYVSAEEGRLPDAINDMKLLVRSFPDNASWAVQLASFYQMDKRPRKAIEVATDVIRRESKNWQALRIRADSRLSTGEHDLAVDDYEQALTAEIDIVASKAGILNNLSWVLSTSPKDDLRDGERALKYGKEAAELTEFKEAHILSTLAAAYAEQGDFEKAIEWSSKAVELGKGEEHEQLDQLKNELESYKNNKPWREEQNVEENKAPVFSPDDIIDT